MNNDLISRQAAIEAIEKHKHNILDGRKWDSGIEYGYAAAHNHICEVISHIPTAKRVRKRERERKNTMRWIPVSERLPEISEYHVSEPCFVYCSNGAYGFAELEENLFGQVGWNCERDDEYHDPLGEVLAWMPLPEPYKGKGGEEG